MIASLILAVALTGQVTYLPPMTPAQMKAYIAREGFVYAKPTAKQLAQARRNDAWNRRYAQGKPWKMRLTIHQAVRLAVKYPPGHPIFRGR